MILQAQRPYDAAEAFIQQQRSVGISSNPIPYTSAGSSNMYPSMTQQGHLASAPPAYSLAPSAPSSALAHTLPRQYHTPIYPTLNDYMGLDLSPETIAQNMPEYSVSAAPASVRICFCFQSNLLQLCVLYCIY